MVTEVVKLDLGMTELGREFVNDLRDTTYTLHLPHLHHHCYRLLDPLGLNRVTDYPFSYLLVFVYVRRGPVEVK